MKLLHSCPVYDCDRANRLSIGICLFCLLSTYSRNLFPPYPYTRHMKKPLLIIVALIVLLVAGFFAFNAYIYKEKQGDGKAVTSYRGTLTGTQVCLPHADTDGPQTLECALGMKTDTGEYYALDFGTLSQGMPPLTDGDRFSATGLITPVEMLSSDHWKKYDIQGILSVTDAVQKL